MRGIFLGRFQPFHKGHLWAIKEALKKVDELIILIGTADESRTSKNPFTAEEREEMINLTLKQENIQNYIIVKLDDIPDDNLYANYVKQHTKKFDIVFAYENAFVASLFEQAGFKVERQPRYKDFEGVLIRKLIFENKPFEHLLPQAIIDWLEKNNGLNLIKDHYKP